MSNKEVKKPVKRGPTIRQNRVISLVAKGGISKAQILRESGYSKSVVKNPKRVFDLKPVKDAVDEVVDRLCQERINALNLLSQKRPKASYRDLIDGLDKLTKIIELLAGRPTDRGSYSLSREEEKEFEDLLKRNS